jgi:hypothetical protein
VVDDLQFLLDVELFRCWQSRGAFQIHFRDVERRELVQGKFVEWTHGRETLCLESAEPVPQGAQAEGSILRHLPAIARYFFPSHPHRVLGHVDDAFGRIVRCP